MYIMTIHQAWTIGGQKNEATSKTAYRENRTMFTAIQGGRNHSGFGFMEHLLSAPLQGAIGGQPEYDQVEFIASPSCGYSIPQTRTGGP
jgi:hypothetical protein